MHFELDFPSHLRWLGHHWLPEIGDIGGLAKPAMKMVQAINPIGRGLDIGCGTGYFALQLARDTKLRMLGIDIYEPFVLRARTQAQSESLDCEFEIGDAHSLLKREEFLSTFSIVVTLASGDVFASPVATASEVFHVIRTGGYFLIGWIADKKSVEIEVIKLSRHLEDNLSSTVISTFSEDSIFDFGREVARSNEKVDFDVGRLSEKDAETLRTWARHRLDEMRPSSGRVSTKTVLLAKKCHVC